MPSLTFIGLRACVRLMPALAHDVAKVALKDRNVPLIPQLASCTWADTVKIALAQGVPKPVHPFLQTRFAHIKKGKALADKLNKAC